MHVHHDHNVHTMSSIHLVITQKQNVRLVMYYYHHHHHYLYYSDYYVVFVVYFLILHMDYYYLMLINKYNILANHVCNLDMLV